MHTNCEFTSVKECILMKTTDMAQLKINIVLPLTVLTGAADETYGH